MDDFEINIGNGVGELKFGMMREKVRAMLGKYEKSCDGYDVFVETPYYITAGYNADDALEYVAFNNQFNSICLHLGKLDIAKQRPPLLLLYHLSQIVGDDGRIKIMDDGYYCDELGIAVSYKEAIAIDVDTDLEVIFEKLDSVAITVQNYWKDHLGY